MAIPFGGLLGNSSNRKAKRAAYSRRLELIGLEERITPTNFTVSNLADSGPGSLRQAMINANASDANPDNILFDIISGTIALGSALPTVAPATTVGPLTIFGLGASKLTISGFNGETDRNFGIFAIATGGDLTITGFTVSDARTTGGGGAFHNSGTLAIFNSTLSNNNANEGGAISNSGILAVSNSTLSGNRAGNNGGAISNSGTLTVDNSTLHGNLASLFDGGAIYNVGGTAIITNSTISGNSAHNGGGIYNRSGTLAITNSTISGNRTDNNGGAIRNSGTLAVSNSTLSDNIAGFGGSLGFGGGISNSGTLNITNSTVSVNSANGNGGGMSNSGTLNIANIILANNGNGDYSGSGKVKLIGTTTKENNLVTLGNFFWATTVINSQLNLGPLQNNGGPTQTMALLPGSVAIAAGNSTISDASPINGLDQRGFTRVTSDIGAFAVSNSIQVTNTSDDGLAGSGSLRAAINLANGTPGNDQISINLTEPRSSTFTLGSALPTIPSAATAGTLTITGMGSSLVVISGDNGKAARDFNIFNIASGGNLNISELTVSGAKTIRKGGAFQNSGTLAIFNSTLTGNSAGDAGGAISNSGTVTISNSTLSFNGSEAGGAISNSGTVTISNSTLSRNSATRGGGIDNGDSSTLTVINSTLVGNFSGGFSAGIFNSGTLNIANTILANDLDYFGSPNVNLIGPSTKANNLVTQKDLPWATTVTKDDLKLGPLQFNGGTTQTIALLNGSVAIGTGNATISNAAPVNGLDQRGYTRSSTFPSIGAFEYNAGPKAPLVIGTSPSPSSGGSSTVTIYDPNTGEATGTAVPFPGFKGPLKVVSGDFDNDGIAEIFAGAGEGGGPAIAILNSQTGEIMVSFFAFDSAFRGGVFVAVQDVNNDGTLDIIAGAGAGGGPHVKIFNGKDLTELGSFFAFDQGFAGGVSVASGDINGDGIMDIVTGAGPGGGPHVKVFDGASLSLISQWFAYSPDFTGGVFVAVGDIGNDGKFEVVTGAGVGGGPVVAVFDPFTGALQTQFFAFEESFTGGVRVGVSDSNFDGVPDLVTGAGPGGGPHVKGFNYPQLDLLFEFFSGPVDDTGGVFVS